MTTKKDSRFQDLLKITINSTAYFMLAYIVFIVLINFIALLMAKVFYGTQGTLYHYGFDLNNGNFSWSLESVVLIFFIGVFVALLAAVYFQILYKSIRKVTMHYKLFFLWFYLIAYTVFLGDIIFGTFLNYMPGAFFNYMFLPIPVRIIIGIVALALLYIIGVKSARNVMISLNIYLQKASAAEVRPYLAAQILFPFIVGNILIFALKIPYQAKFQYIDTFVLLTMAIIIVAVFVKSMSMDSIKFNRHHDSFKLKRWPIILAILAILLFRFGLGLGLSI